MPMKTRLHVVLRGDMTPAKLERARLLLDLLKRGRWDDRDDWEFGYRYLRDDDPNWVRLSLMRIPDGSWTVDLSYQTEPPTDEVVEQFRTRILAMAAELDMTIV
jgi:hypothetical protein